MSAGRHAGPAHLVMLLLLAAGCPTLVAQVPHLNQAPPPTRQGLWFSGGVGYGSANCGPQGGRVGGPSGGLAIGWTLNRRIQLGVGMAGWTRSGFGVTGYRMSIGTVDARIRFYPDPKFGFFFTGGFGLGIIRFSDENGVFNHTGTGIIGGAGYDIPVTEEVSLTPFANFYAVRTWDPNSDVGQIGLAVTVY